MQRRSHERRFLFETIFKKIFDDLSPESVGRRIGEKHTIPFYRSAFARGPQM
jgi:hypothetical protein